MSASTGKTGSAIRCEIASSDDVVRVRQKARELSQLLGFSLTDMTKIVTCASELARNALEHGGGGYAELESCSAGARIGIMMTFQDQGPGIPDIEQALRDGFTTGGGMGLGLGGSRRLMSELSIESSPRKGTRVVAKRWK
jgi:serine/threonine-protein kinase RsbT